MLTLSAPLQSAIASNSVKVKPKIIVDFDYNRIATTVNITNNGSSQADYTGEYAKLWNLENILLPALAFKSGNQRATINHGKVYSKDTDISRSRICSEDDVYVNWRNPTPATAGGVVSDFDVIIDYNATVSMNHIGILFETSVSAPDNVEIQTWNGSWTSVGTFSPDSDGWVKIYRGTSSWSTTYNVDNSISASKIRFIVTGVSLTPSSSIIPGATNDPNAGDDVFVLVHYAHASLLTDMSDRVVSFGSNQSQQATNETSRATALYADDLSIEIENTDEYFDRGNASSPYYNMMKYRLPVHAYLSYDTSDHGGAGWEDVQIGEFITESWNESPTDSIVNIQCSDRLSMLQEAEPPIFMCVDYKISQIFREIMHRIGATDLTINIDAVNDVVLPYFWSDGELGIFEILNELLNAIPASMHTNYVGSFSILDLKTQRDQAKSSNLSESSDVISANVLSELVNNDIEITYRDYAPNEGDGVTTNGFESVWQPESTHLQAWKLKSNITDASTHISLDLTDNVEFYNSLLGENENLYHLGYYLGSDEDELFATIPESGFVNIEGERISWNGKDDINRRLIIDERAYLDTTQNAHIIDTTRSNGTSVTDNDIVFRWDSNISNPGRRIRTQNGSRRLSNSIDNSKATLPQLYNSWSFQRIWTGEASSRTPFVFTKSKGACGFKFKFNDESQMAFNIVGLAIKESKTDDKGFFLEFFEKAKQVYNDTEHGEIRPYKATSSNVQSTRVGLPTSRPNGYHAKVNDYGWNYLDVTFDNTTNEINVFYNGKLVTSVTDSVISDLSSPEFYIFARGHTDVYVDFAYATSSDKQFQSQSFASIHNPKTGTFISGMWVQFMERVRKYDDGVAAFKEWVPTVREGREFEGKYQKLPVTSPAVFLSNRYEAAVTRGYLTPFGFDIAVENIADSGNDAFLTDIDLTYESVDVLNETGTIQVPQHFFISGRPIVSSPDLNYTYIDSESIRRNGRRFIQLDLPWVQGIDHAKAIITNIQNDWTDIKQNIQIEWVPNPAVEVADTVGLDYSSRNFTSTGNIYYVTSKSISYADGGVTGSLTLLRK